MKQRMHIIHEIRALESTRSVRHAKMVDLSSTGGHKLLGEMSIVEVGCCKGRCQWSRWVVVRGDVNGPGWML